MRYLSGSYVRKAYPKRPEWSRKGDFGRLLVVGGSATFYGAPALSATAALRAGCDLVKIVAPENSASVYASVSPNLIVEPVTGNCFNAMHTRKLLDVTGGYDAVVLGPGLGLKSETFTFVHNLLSRLDVPCVIDADAIKAVSSARELLKPGHILTPHSMEFQVIFGREPSKNLRERTLQVKGLASELGCTILLKGHIDVISNGESTALNKTGTPYMTRGGTGDTLSGICGALLAMGLEPFHAACSAAYLNGLAGEMASKSLGPGTLATDVLSSIPVALRKILK
jgi:NAD(P)H-hydrate epimerase